MKIKLYVRHWVGKFYFLRSLNFTKRLLPSEVTPLRLIQKQWIALTLIPTPWVKWGVYWDISYVASTPSYLYGAHWTLEREVKTINVRWIFHGFVPIDGSDGGKVTLIQEELSSAQVKIVFFTYIRDGKKAYSGGVFRLLLFVISSLYGTHTQTSSMANISILSIIHSLVTMRRNSKFRDTQLNLMDFLFSSLVFTLFFHKKSLNIFLSK